jgi:arylsulfatase A-like enzyme
VKNQLVSTLDILPTLVDIAGGELPDGLDGRSLVPWVLRGEEAKVRDHLAIGGIHARVWAFNGATSFFEHNVSREKAPSGYVVADDRYILRYVSETIPNLYRDAVDGIPAHYELYDYTKDPGEQHNMADQYPERVQQMKAIWKRESTAYPKPVEWGEDKWKAMMDG